MISCPLWHSNKSNPGNFDEAGYEIDHIVEWSLTQNDNTDNLQALCPTCHKVKTKRFLINKKIQKVPLLRTLKAPFENPRPLKVQQLENPRLLTVQQLEKQRRKLLKLPQLKITLAKKLHMINYLMNLMYLI